MDTTLAIDAAMRRFIAALDDPEAGGTVLGAYAPEARVWFEGRLVEARTLEAEAFARAFASAHAAAPRPTLAEPALTSIRLDGDDRAVAGFSAREADRGQTLHLAAGFVRREADWRLGWLTLAAAPADWTYAFGLAQTLADHPYGETRRFATPRSWLDIAYYRLYDLPRPPLVTLPDARFSCQGSTGCCTPGFTTLVPESAQAFLDAVPWETVAPDLAGKTTLPRHGDRDRLLKGPDETCRFLAANGGCRIHQAFGRPVFEPCTQYPFSFAATPDGVVVAASGACPSARANCGTPLADRRDDLYARLAMDDHVVPTTFRLAPGVEVDWPRFKAAEAAALAALENREAPLHQALADALTGLCDRLGLAAAVPAGGMRADDGYLQLFEAHMGGPYGAPTRPRGPLDEAQAAPVREIVRQLVFAKKTSFNHDLLTTLRVGALVVALATHYGRMATGALPGELLRRVGGLATHGGNGEHSMADLLAASAAMLDGGEVGLWLLASCDAPAGTSSRP